MLYVMTGTIHSHLSDDQRKAGLKRRAEWKYPQGIKVVGEFWRADAPQIISVFETDSYDPILAFTLTWGDFMEMSISPATTAEAGLAAGARLMGAGR